MSASDKKFIIELPLKVILTEDGASNFISHNKKLMRFRLADNIDEYGISLNKFSDTLSALNDGVDKETWFCLNLLFKFMIKGSNWE